mmetsp:Transcript_6319/g.17895  ORF Transcript_6319/g.17895 Transcript_6319/m.17895 type:complete len:317 (+) Transcript_6319:93-1043(+)|eukprot:CAMPEP_0119118736 /NCGR_PEP_ID=MMETSP1310-20130426/513_1 /TAXON_ID=464262 /ORGANISM="Genus nov. species nov., Strain RCC2339" /LENGTH=316 /DNA_ID=CAMNT_0007108123 /DNA_START=66 /DNA_END=1016 /DNA_ORIENTATION=+
MAETKNFFRDVKVERFLLATWTADKVQTIGADVPIHKAAEILAESGIQAAPVVDKEHGFVGMLHARDMVVYVKKRAPEFLLKDENKEVTWDEYLKETPHLGYEPVGQLFGEEGVVKLKRHYVCCSPHDELLKPAAFLAGGVRKVLVQSGEGDITHIVTATALVKYMQKHLDHACFEGVRGKTLQDAGFVQSSVVSCTDAATLASAVLTCHERNVAGLCIVNSDGVAVANFSDKDVTCLTTSGFPLLRLPVVQYLKEHHEESCKVVGVTPSTTFEDALAKLVETKHHRLWILDDGKPVGCFSPSDVIRHSLKLLKEA